MGDATVAVASCPVNVPFRPERHRQSGPIQTMGSLTAKEVIGTLTTYEVLLMLDPEGAEAHQDDLLARVLKIDDAVMRHLATKHIEGSRTSAPRDETPAPAPVAVPQYEAPPTETDEEE